MATATCYTRLDTPELALYTLLRHALDPRERVLVACDLAGAAFACWDLTCTLEFASYLDARRAGDQVAVSERFATCSIPLRDVETPRIFASGVMPESARGNAAVQLLGALRQPPTAGKRMARQSATYSAELIASCRACNNTASAFARVSTYKPLAFGTLLRVAAASLDGLAR